MKEKLKIFGLPIGIMLLFVCFLFIHQLLLVKQVPQPNWSRSIPLEFSFNERPQLFNDNDTMYISSNGKIHSVSFDDQLNVSKNEVMDTKITRGYPFWTDGNQIIYYKEGSLVSTENNEGTVLSKNVTGLGTGINDVYYWSGNQLKAYNPKDGSSKNIFTFSSEISDIHVGHNGSAIIQVKIDDTHDNVYYINEKKEVSEHPFMVVNTAPNKKVDGLVFTLKDNQLVVLYNEKSRTQGALSYKVYKVQVPVSEIGTSIVKASKMETFNKENKQQLVSPAVAQIVNLNGKESILFTSEGQRVGENSEIRLYIAPFNLGNQLKGVPINTTRNVTYLPVQNTAKSLIWFNYDGDSYELFGASQDKQVISASKHWTKRSVREAINNGIIMIFSTLITVITSFYWTLPPLFLLILLYIFRPNDFEKEGINWVEYASIVLFLLMPVTYTGNAMDEYFYQMAPDYFTFPGSHYVILLFLSAITALIWKIGRDPDWGSFAGVFYFVGIYILLYMTSVGPYFFNLF